MKKLVSLASRLACVSAVSLAASSCAKLTSGSDVSQVAPIQQNSNCSDNIEATNTLARNLNGLGSVDANVGSRTDVKIQNSSRYDMYVAMQGGIISERGGGKNYRVQSCRVFLAKKDRSPIVPDNNETAGNTQCTAAPRHMLFQHQNQWISGTTGLGNYKCLVHDDRITITYEGIVIGESNLPSRAAGNKIAVSDKCVVDEAVYPKIRQGSGVCGGEELSKYSHDQNWVQGNRNWAVILQAQAPRIPDPDLQSVSPPDTQGTTPGMPTTPSVITDVPVQKAPAPSVPDRTCLNGKTAQGQVCSSTPVQDKVPAPAPAPIQQSPRCQTGDKTCQNLPAPTTPTNPSPDGQY